MLPTTTDMTTEKMQSILEAALMIAGYPLSITAMQNLFSDEKPNQADIKLALNALQERYSEHGGLQLQEVASGYRLQTKSDLSPWLSKLLEERTPRYSRAFLETLAIIAYKQPITRAEIEEIRGVAVSSQIIKTLLEREWVRVIGYRELPGKPAILGTTKDFLDHFDLKSLTDLPTLSELKNWDDQEKKLSQMQLEMTNEKNSNETNDEIQTDETSLQTNDVEIQTQ